MSEKLPDSNTRIRVALTEKHGMALELSKYPPTGVEYSFIDPVLCKHRIIRSPIKGYLGHYSTKDHDLIEAILSPALTNNKWIYYLENIQAASAFSFLGCPLPRAIRMAYLKHLFLKDNFKKLVFWSQAGKNTLSTYGGITDKRILSKVAVVYPAIREVPDNLIRYSNNEVNLLFSGDFFRKGGVNVIDAFERVQRIYPFVTLILCCDEKRDFNTSNISLRAEYLQKIKANNRIISRGRIPRDELINTVLPQIDIYLLPTYAETFGFAILEAMAYGIPVISTNHFAIPEMIEHDTSGLLIDISKYDCERLFKGYVVNSIPTDFRDLVTEKLYEYLCQLIESSELREKYGRSGLNTARTKFSFDQRNSKIFDIYREAIGLR